MMKHRKLRIAWSVVWGTVAVLLVALWVRSYWRWDQIAYGASQHVFMVWSHSGVVDFMKVDRARSSGAFVYGWKVTILPSPDQNFFPIGGNDLTYAGFSFERLTDGIVFSLPQWFLVPIAIA